MSDSIVKKVLLNLKIRSLVHDMAAFSLLAASAFSFAESHHHEHENEAAHVHGEADMMLVMQGSDMEISLLSPAINIVGFEHQAVEKKDIKKVDDMILKLSKPDEFLNFNGIDCALEKASDNLSGFKHDDDDHHHEHDHHHDEHKQHKNVEITYKYQCKPDGSLKSMKIGFFALFSGLNVLELQWVINESSGLSKLNRDSNSVTFK